MLKVRKTKTGSNKTAVQVVRRENQETIVVKHIGSSNINEELENFYKLADEFIQNEMSLVSLFPDEESDNSKSDLVSIKNLKFVNIYHNFAYEFLNYFYEYNGFNSIDCKLLKDLSIMRIIEPCSKMRSMELLNKYFGFNYTKNKLYKNLGSIKKFSTDIENVAIEYAKKNLNFDFSIVFYDVTTLYFESFTSDELRKFGFSKDNKGHQPQVVISLVVNEDGYPISINMYEGNKYEGHTLIPAMIDLKNKYDIKSLTVVADAGMLSFDNINELKKHDLNFIVGARMSGLKKDLLQGIASKLDKTEKLYYKVETKYGYLICDYSKKRASKDKSDRKKSIEKAEKQLKNPGKINKRLRFVKETVKSKFELNNELIEKDELLDGIKGYYTNLDNLKSSLIVSRYKDLWRVEKSFRIAKSDLMARPIFHHKKESIEVHILIIFVSLCLSKSIELLTNLSIKRVRDVIMEISDIEFVDKLTGKKFLERMDTEGNKMIEFLEKIKKSCTY